MKRVFVASLVVLAGAMTVWADGKNLQHFPKEMKADDLKAQMKVIARSLGTKCEGCHQVTPERDFGVDTEKKKTARSMLDMTDKMTKKCLTAEFLGSKRSLEASCFMCHKGAEKPSLEPKDPADEKTFNDDVAAGKHKRWVVAMKKLVDELNKNYFTWKDAPKATCWMCHRGQFKLAKMPKETVADDAEKKSD